MNVKIKIIAIIFISVAFVAIGSYFSFQRFYFTKAPIETVGERAEKINPSEKIPIKLESEKHALSAIKLPAPKTETIFPGYKFYKNSEFGFEIQYPISWTVTEEINENVRGEMVKEFYFKKPGSDLRFAILPRDGLSYGLPNNGTTTDVTIGGSAGSQTQFTLANGRRLWLLRPNYGLFNWSQDIGRIDIMTSIEDPTGDTQIFEKMLNSFKLSK